VDRTALHLARVQFERVDADGSVTLTVAVTANEHVLGEVPGWVGACQVVAPADVRDALQRRIAALESVSA